MAAAPPPAIGLASDASVRRPLATRFVDRSQRRGLGGHDTAQARVDAKLAELPPFAEMHRKIDAVVKARREDGEAIRDRIASLAAGIANESTEREEFYRVIEPQLAALEAR